MYNDEQYNENREHQFLQAQKIGKVRHYRFTRWGSPDFHFRRYHKRGESAGNDTLENAPSNAPVKRFCR